MSVPQEWYELVQCATDDIKPTKEKRLCFQLLMELSSLIYANINKASTKVMACSDVSFTGEATLYYTFELCRKSQRSMLSTYITH